MRTNYKNNGQPRMRPGLTERLSSLLRGGAGRSTIVRTTAQQQPLVIYEFEGCPFCRKAREAISHLDLDAIFYPCPKGGQRYRPEALTQSGKTQFPFLVDPATDTALLESDAIVHYLYDTYANGRRPLLARTGFLDNAGSGFASMLRGHRGSICRPSRPNRKPLTLYSYDSQPDAFAIRESLTTLELAWQFKSTAPGARAYDPARPEPRLTDPDTGQQLSGTNSIVDYLEQHYAL